MGTAPSLQLTISNQKHLPKIFFQAHPHSNLLFSLCNQFAEQLSDCPPLFQSAVGQLRWPIRDLKQIDRWEFQVLWGSGCVLLQIFHSLFCCAHQLASFPLDSFAQHFSTFVLSFAVILTKNYVQYVTLLSCFPTTWKRLTLIRVHFKRATFMHNQ